MENGDYLYIQTSETSYDYTLYGPDYKELDGGQLDNPDLSLAEAGKEILAAYELSAGKMEPWPATGWMIFWKQPNRPMPFPSRRRGTGSTAF